jgi:hypothetical protein
VNNGGERPRPELLSDTQNYKAALDYLKFSGYFLSHKSRIDNLKAHREEK